jgi:16S rRNA (guanine966-N2)-methyltransferase
MRIISGTLKGSSLYITKDKTTRPLKDLARESIFNVLDHSNKLLFKLERSNILDLYAGTGSFGLECMSRKARYVCFVENNKNAINILKKNVEKLKINEKAKVIFNDTMHLIKKKNIFNLKFDLVFCDPPFLFSNTEKLIELISVNNLLNKNGIIILHRNKNTKEKFPTYFRIVEEKVYGISKIIFGKLLS